MVQWTGILASHYLNGGPYVRNSTPLDESAVQQISPRILLELRVGEFSSNYDRAAECAGRLR